MSLLEAALTRGATGGDAARAEGSPTGRPPSGVRRWVDVTRWRWRFRLDWSRPTVWEVDHPVAAELHGTAPGPALAARLHGLEPEDEDEAAPLESVAAWDRLASWVAAGQVRDLAELHRRERGARAGFLADEVAVTLSVTTAVAEGKVALAVELDRMPAVADALGRGEVDVRRATVLTDELSRLDDATAHRVATEVLPRAATCTAPQLRSRLRRMELLRDPDGAAQRHERAREQRRVELVPAPDAMAWLNAYLPADDARALHDTLTALAAEAAPEDARTLDQRRADALVDVTTRWLDAGAHPDGTPLPTRQGRRPHLTVTASAAMLAGLTGEPAELHGYGPIPPDMARRIASRSTWEPLLVDAGSGEPLARSTRRYAPTQAQRDLVLLRDRTCTFVGCRMPAARCDIDHVVPYVEGADETAAPQTRVDNLQALCRHHLRLKTHGGWTPERRTDGVTAWTDPTGRSHERQPEHAPPVAPPPHPPDRPSSSDPSPPEPRRRDTDPPPF